MNGRLTGFTLLCSLLLGGASFSQDDTSTSAENPDKLSLTYYYPKNISYSKIRHPFENLHHRRISLSDRTVENIMEVGDSILLYDTEANTDLMLKTLAILDANDSGDSSNSSPQSDTLTTLGAHEVVSYVFRPQYASGNLLKEKIQDSFGRRVTINNRRLDNISYGSHAGEILIQDSEEYVSMLIGKLQELDAVFKPDSMTIDDGEGVSVKEYRPRWISLDSVGNALTTLYDHQQRGVQVTTGTVPVYQFTPLAEQGTVLIRASQHKMEEALSLLKQIDRPSPQINVTCQIVFGIDGVSNNRPASQVVSGLKKLLPHEDYSVVATGILRTSVTPDSSLVLEMESDDSGSFSLFLEMGAFDSESGAIQLQTARVSWDGHQLFSTSTTVNNGEYAVLGAVGSDPIFVVIRMTPISGDPK